MSNQMKLNILCVDDEQDILDSLHDTFTDKYNVFTALNSKEAMDIFKKKDIVLVITDQRMTGLSGSDLLAEINAINPLCRKILLTGYADIEPLIDAINNGAIDKYFPKPWDDDELALTVDQLVMKHRILSRLFGENKDAYDSLTSLK